MGSPIDDAERLILKIEIESREKRGRWLTQQSLPQAILFIA